ncbi:hypothetical protein SNEBB_006359 [Seison nebaliae]|nr:hypothetical protein SNEBB_006359 [Seison nebaliae]
MLLLIITCLTVNLSGGAISDWVHEKNEETKPESSDLEPKLGKSYFRAKKFPEPSPVNEVKGRSMSPNLGKRFDSVRSFFNKYSDEGNPSPPSNAKSAFNGYRRHGAQHLPSYLQKNSNGIIEEKEDHDETHSPFMRGRTVAPRVKFSDFQENEPSDIYRLKSDDYSSDISVNNENDDSTNQLNVENNDNLNQKTLAPKVNDNGYSEDSQTDNSKLDYSVDDSSQSKTYLNSHNNVENRIFKTEYDFNDENDEDNKIEPEPEKIYRSEVKWNIGTKPSKTKTHYFNIKYDENDNIKNEHEETNEKHERSNIATQTGSSTKIEELDKKQKDVAVQSANEEKKIIHTEREIVTKKEQVDKMKDDELKETEKELERKEMELHLLKEKKLKEKEEELLEKRIEEQHLKHQQRMNDLKMKKIEIEKIKVGEAELEDEISKKEEEMNQIKENMNEENKESKKIEETLKQTVIQKEVLEKKVIFDKLTQTEKTEQISNTLTNNQKTQNKATETNEDDMTNSVTETVTNSSSNFMSNSKTNSANNAQTQTVDFVDSPTNVPSKYSSSFDSPTDSPADSPTDSPADSPTNSPIVSSGNSPSKSPIQSDSPTQSKSDHSLETISDLNTGKRMTSTSSQTGDDDISEKNDVTNDDDDEDEEEKDKNSENEKKEEFKRIEANVVSLGELSTDKMTKVEDITKEKKESNTTTINVVKNKLSQKSIEIIEQERFRKFVRLSIDQMTNTMKFDYFTVYDMPTDRKMSAMANGLPLTKFMTIDNREVRRELYESLRLLLLYLGQIDFKNLPKKPRSIINECFDEFNTILFCRNFPFYTNIYPELLPIIKKHNYVFLPERNELNLYRNHRLLIMTFIEIISLVHLHSNEVKAKLLTYFGVKKRFERQQNRIEYDEEQFTKILNALLNYNDLDSYAKLQQTAVRAINPEICAKKKELGALSVEHSQHLWMMREFPTNDYRKRFREIVYCYAKVNDCTQILHTIQRIFLYQMFPIYPKEVLPTSQTTLEEYMKGFASKIFYPVDRQYRFKTSIVKNVYCPIIRYYIKIYDLFYNQTTNSVYKLPDHIKDEVFLFTIIDGVKQIDKHQKSVLISTMRTMPICKEK